MNALAQFLIDQLTDFQTLTPTGQVAWLIGILGVLSAPFVWLRYWAKAKDSGYAKDLATAKLKLVTSEKAVSELNADVTRLETHDPASVLQSLDIDRRDNNLPRQIKTADDYVGHHRAAFAQTCAILTNHHLTRYEDGKVGLDRARAAAMGALAADPGNKDYELALEEIEALIRVESAPATDQQHTKAREERARLRKRLQEAAGDITALLAVGDAEFSAGRYRNALAFFERAAAEASGPNGPGRNSQPDIAIRRRIGETLTFAGKYARAEALLAPLAETASRVLGAENDLTLTTRYTLAQAILAQGRAEQAEALFRDLLPLREKGIGARASGHPDHTLHPRPCHPRSGPRGAGRGAAPRPAAAARKGARARASGHPDHAFHPRPRHPRSGPRGTGRGAVPRPAATARKGGRARASAHPDHAPRTRPRHPRSGPRGTGRGAVPRPAATARKGDRAESIRRP